MQKGGFFNSTDHDRRYSALDFNQLIDTIKSDGIDQYGDKLEVIAGEGLNVIVKSGKAFYNQHWLFNDANLTLELEQASPTQDRIDAIIIEVNETDRTMLIKAVTGEPSDTPVAPALVETTNIHQYYLAWVEVDTGSLVVGTITDKRTQWADIESPNFDNFKNVIFENYKEGVTEQIDNLINSQAYVEDTNVASKDYVVGDYLTINGVFYKVAVAITEGDTLVVGTNITTTDTGTELVGAINSAKASAINLATIEPTNIASQTYTVGRYLVYNGLLYKVTSAIAQGATLQVGVNIEQTTVGTELNNLTKVPTVLVDNQHVLYTAGTFFTATRKCRVFMILYVAKININNPASATDYLIEAPNTTNGSYINTSKITEYGRRNLMISQLKPSSGGNLLVAFDLWKGDYVSVYSNSTAGYLDYSVVY